MARLAAPAPTPIADDLLGAPERDTSVEVATTGADTLRAGVRVAGNLTKPACAILVCVLRAHLGAGRHYLRVDLAEAPVLDPEVLDSLVQLHLQVTTAGGMLVFENAVPRVLETLRSSALFVRAAS